MVVSTVASEPGPKPLHQQNTTQDAVWVGLLEEVLGTRRRYVQRSAMRSDPLLKEAEPSIRRQAALQGEAPNDRAPPLGWAPGAKHTQHTEPAAVASVPGEL